MRLRLRRVALVTGGMGSLGEAICIKLAALGYHVVTTRLPESDKTDERLTRKKDECSTYRVYPCDASDPNSAQQCVAVIEKDVGAITVLINNAVFAHNATFKKMEKLDRDEVIKAKLEAVFNMTKSVCDGMVERGWGRIINITSVHRQNGPVEQIYYSPANSEETDIYGFTKALALEVARKAVTVNTISHADLSTEVVEVVPRDVLNTQSVPHISLGRHGKGEEIAGLVAYLASDEAAFLTGANIAIKGGRHMY